MKAVSNPSLKSPVPRWEAHVKCYGRYGAANVTKCHACKRWHRINVVFDGTVESAGSARRLSALRVPRQSPFNAMLNQLSSAVNRRSVRSVRDNQA